MFFRELETDRLVLKNMSAEDRDFIFALFSNDIVNRYLFDAEPLMDIQEADELISFYTQPEPREHHRWLLIRKEGNVKIGTCGFHCWDKSTGCCDVGYDLHPDFWGNGYMVEALQAIIAFAQNNMKVRHINACISIDNGNSFKLAKKCGFVFTGQMKDEIFRGNRYPHKILTLACDVFYKENILRVEDYILFHKKMGWVEPSKEQSEKSLAHNLFSIVAIKDDEIIGMGRLLGDAVQNWYINDVFVLANQQGKGIGSAIIKRLVQYVRKNTMNGISATMYLFCSKDKEGFYKRLGFMDTNEADAVGMFKDVGTEEDILALLRNDK